MVNKTRFYLAVLLLCVPILFGGCQTCKGIAEGLPRDVVGFWSALKNADTWFKRNFW